MHIIDVSTTCPFCGGTASLMRAESHATNAALTKQFRGTTVRCIHWAAKNPSRCDAATSRSGASSGTTRAETNSGASPKTGAASG